MTNLDTSGGSHGRPAGQVLSVDGPVLLVEDDLIIALDTGDILAELGIREVLTAANVSDALALLSAHRPTVALLDVHLGAVTSLDVARALAEASVPTILTTGVSPDEMDPDFPKAQMLRKPYDKTDLILAISAALGGD